MRVLKRFLEYAEVAGRAPVERIGVEPDSDFEVEVADRLRARGFEVDLQVGVSGFKIDLGVRHPDHPERFLVGVECDGARYHSSKSARDRDRLREEVLRSRGWEILRVWSTDWFDDPDLQTEKLVGRLNEIRTRPVLPQDEYRIATSYAHAEQAISDEIGIFHHHFPPRGEEPSAAEPQSIAVTLPDPSTHFAPMEDFATERPWEGDGFLTKAEVHRVLSQFRDTVIAAEMTDWEGHRSILREAMIDTFVAQRITDPDEWFMKVPQYQRAGTNPVEKSRYLARICDIVARLQEPSRAACGMRLDSSART